LAGAGKKQQLALARRASFEAHVLVAHAFEAHVLGA
jgi:hypothetical protein